jgi:hypothetical protein
LKKTISGSLSSGSLSVQQNKQKELKSVNQPVKAVQARCY